MANNCADCFYAWYISGIKQHCCRYYIMTNTRRPCPAGDGCTVKVRRVPRWKTDLKRKKVNNRG